MEWSNVPVIVGGRRCMTTTLVAMAAFDVLSQVMDR